MREVLYRLARRDGLENLAHPLVDGVVLGVRWVDFEPTRGRYRTAELAAGVRQWQGAGKRVLLRFIPYGQAEDGLVTPEWAYELLPRVQLAAGQSIPNLLGGLGPYAGRAVYLEALFPRILKALAGVHADQILVSCGQNGDLAATTDRQGGEALLASGWTPKAWSDFCLRVLVLTPPPLSAMVSFLMLRSRRDFSGELEDLVSAFAHREGARIITLGLESSADDMPATVARLRRLPPGQGLGDDWPLWVPPGPRRNAKPTRGRDDLDFVRALAQAQVLGARSLLIQEPECTASRPGHQDFVPAVHAALSGWRAA